jgi:hypothetical protein
MNRTEDGGVMQNICYLEETPCTIGVDGLSDLPNTKTIIGKHERVSRR